MPNLDVSVIVPSYNRSDFLRECLDSILNQTKSAKEIIVVNDGSTDNTQEILSNYDTRIRSLTIENSGAGNARRVGAEMATSEWLAFCDSDDLWLPHHLERREKLLTKYPEVNFSFSNMAAFGPNASGNATYFRSASESWWDQIGDIDADGMRLITDQPYEKILSFNPVPTPTIVMTQELYHKVGGINSKYSRMPAEDADLTRKSFAIATICCDMEVTAKQRRHDENMSLIEAENLLGKIRILQDHIDEKICPPAVLDRVQKEILETKKLAVQAAYYKDMHSLSGQLSEQIKFSQLNMKTALKLLYLKLKNKVVAIKS